MEDNPKFQQITSTAKDLFWKYGIKRVSIEEICKEANVSKMTFYKHFPNKIELAKYILDKVFHEGLETYKNIMNSDLGFHERVEQVMIMKMKNSNDISPEFLNDVYKNNTLEIQDHMNQFVAQSFMLFRTDMEKARAKGEIRQSVNVDFLMAVLNKLIEIGLDESTQQMFENPQEMIRELVKMFYFGVMPDDN